MFSVRRRRKLPHLEAPGTIYFVTFRLADSLPRKVLTDLEREARRDADPDPVAAPRRDRVSPRIEKYLDSGTGACFLARTEVAVVVANAVGIFSGVRYELFARCVMPNHVHAVIQPIGEWCLSSILHTWKSFSASEANRLLHRSGEFWQREYYDHVVRDKRDLKRVTSYVLENPVRAGLHEWPWVGIGPYRS